MITWYHSGHYESSTSLPAVTRLTVYRRPQVVLRKNEPFEFHWDQKKSAKGAIGPYIVKPNGSELDLVVQNATPSLFSRILPTTDETSNAIRAEIPSDNETDGEADQIGTSSTSHRHISPEWRLIRALSETVVRLKGQTPSKTSHRRQNQLSHPTRKS